MQQPATYWERVAATRWGQYVSDAERHSILYADSMFEQPADALEVGCEGGRWSRLLADRGWRMTCVDIDKEALDVCQQKIPSANCILADAGANHIPVPASSTSLLLCVEVPIIQGDWFFREARRVMRTGGILVGMMWNRRSWRGAATRLKYRFGFEPDRGFYRHAYSQTKCSVEQLGFRIVYEDGICWGPFGRSSNSRLVPAFVALERIFGLRRMPALSPWVVFVARKEAQNAPGS